MQRIAIVSINQPGLSSSRALYRILADRYDVMQFCKIHAEDTTSFHALDDILPTLWEFDGIVFFLSTGIVVRKLCPFLQSKATDPAVLVMNFDHTQIVPLLSGHLGRANELANEIAKRCDNCICFTTTATDQTGTFAFDLFAKEQGFRIEHIENLAPVSNALLNRTPINCVAYPKMTATLKEFLSGSPVHYYDPDSDFPIEWDLPTVILSPSHTDPRALVLDINNAVVGMGMNRGTPCEEIETAYFRFLDEQGVNYENVTTIASFEAKRDETGLLEFCEKQELMLRFFDSDSINALEEEFSESKAGEYFGIKGVAEPCALLASTHKELFVRKQKCGNLTLALAY